jgi:hypothetical protein
LPPQCTDQCTGDTDGAAGCLHYVCVLGICQTTYCD